MRKLVYLFELDSVQKEADTGAFDALFHEIVDNGNCVAISMNQLTDSSFFAQAIEDDCVYPVVMGLFETGAVKVSLYGKIRTASQYVQSAIERCLSETDDRFVFSNLPVNCNESAKLNIICDALKYSDIGRVRELAGHSSGIKQNELERIERFVRMVLKLSTIDDGSIPAKVPSGRSFEMFLNAAIRLLSTTTFSVEELNCERENFISSLEERSKRITAGRNNRSNWLSIRGGEKDLHPVAVEIINLCYNYTIEDSINGVCKHYDDGNFDESFLEDIKSRIERNHNETYKTGKKPVKKQRWKMLARFAEYGRYQPIAQGGVYEDVLPGKRRLWKKHSMARAVESLGWALFYAALFFSVEWSMEWIERTFAVSLENVWISTLLNIFIFSLVGLIVGLVLKKVNKDQEVPDIFECIKDMFWRIIDCIHVLFGGSI